MATVDTPWLVVCKASHCVGVADEMDNTGERPVLHGDLEKKHADIDVPVDASTGMVLGCHWATTRSIWQYQYQQWLPVVPDACANEEWSRSIPEGYVSWCQVSNVSQPTEPEVRGRSGTTSSGCTS